MNHDAYERMPRIDTPRLYLRPLRRDDAETVVAWRSEPKTAAMFLSPPPTLEQHLAWFDSPRTGRVDYLVVTAESDTPLGTVNFKGLHAGDGSAESGTLIGDVASRGKGYGLEAKVAWSLYGFAILGLDRIDVTVRHDNEPMLRIERAVGYELLGSETLADATGGRSEFVKMTLRARTATRLDVYREHDRHGFVAAIAARLAEQ